MKQGKKENNQDVVEDATLYKVPDTNTLQKELIEDEFNNFYQSISKGNALYGAKTIEFPKGMKVVRGGYFGWEETETENIILPDGIEAIDCDAFNMSSIKQINLPSTLKRIHRDAFSSCHISSINIPPSVCEIEEDAFSGCENLTEITLSPNVKKINKRTFYHCIRLEKIVIPEGVEFIDDEAFAYCGRLKEVSIPSSVKHIGEDVFTYCGSLEKIIVSPDNRFYDSREDCNAIIQTADNTLISGCSNTIIPISVTALENSCFKGCYNKSDFYVHKNIEQIGQYVVASNNNIRTIIVDSNNKYYDSRDNCNAIVETKTDTIISTCTWSTIPPTIRAIGVGAFSHTNIRAITIPDNVTKLGGYAFSSCSYLETIDLPESITTLPEGVFHTCSELRKINVAAKQISLEKESLIFCVKLDYDSLFAKTKYIGENVFLFNLKRYLCIPETVEEIHYHAFDSYSGKLYLPLGFKINKIKHVDAVFYKRNVDHVALYKTAYKEYLRKNYAKAVELFRISARKGYAPAQYNLAVCYYNGIGVRQSERTAVKWLERAATMSHFDSIILLADCYIKGIGCRPNFYSAEYLLDRECVKDSKEAHELKELMDKKLNPDPDDFLTPDEWDLINSFLEEKLKKDDDDE